MSRLLISKVEFYITNVCNLTCDRCNRFNNFDFRGWQRWQDYESVYQAWAQYIDIDHMVILGGEPLLNPTVIDWVEGLNRIWNRNVQILTNGTRLNHVKGLRQVLKQKGNWIGVSWHNLQEMAQLRQIMRDFLGPDLIEIQGKANNAFGGDILFQSRDSIKIPVYFQDKFNASAIRADLSLHDSDPILAHSRCGFVRFKSYHFIRGLLYKCGPVALLPEFDRQFGLKISEPDRELLNSYRPLSIDQISDRMDDFFSALDDPLPQCKFCPVEPETQTISPVTKSTRRMIEISARDRYKLRLDSA